MKAVINRIIIPVICRIIWLITPVFNITPLHAQQKKIDSLKKELAIAKEDTTKIILYETLGGIYREGKKIDSCILMYEQALELNQKIKYSLEKQTWNAAAIDYLLYVTGNYTESLKYATIEMAITEQRMDEYHKGFVYLVFGHAYKGLGEYRESLNEYFKARKVFESYSQSMKTPEDNSYTDQCIGEVFLKMNKLDSALLFTRQAWQHASAQSIHGVMLYSLRIFGDIYLLKGDDETAIGYYRQYIPGFIKYRENNRDLGFVFNNMSRIFQKRNQMDSAICYAKKALLNARQYNDQENTFYAATLLSDYYKESNERMSFDYFKTATKAKDSMISSDKLKQAQILAFNGQVREREKQQADVKEAQMRAIVITGIAIATLLISFLAWYRIRQLHVKYKMVLEQKEVEKLKGKHEKELLELEAKALRAQMNPHFVFNCLNSIKSLIQQQEDEKAVTYLTTFSKLIRTLFNNADKKEISLFDEVETCKLYLQLESMRFDKKFSFSACIDSNIDLKSIYVPALIIQPFLENAIWHGIMPGNNQGNVSFTVSRSDTALAIIIDDNGVGRKTSMQNKPANELTHQSKGVNLTQSRLQLNNLLQQKHASLEIIDKVDENGLAIGTTVIIKIGEES